MSNIVRRSPGGLVVSGRLPQPAVQAINIHAPAAIALGLQASFQIRKAKRLVLVTVLWDDSKSVCDYFDVLVAAAQILVSKLQATGKRNILVTFRSMKNPVPWYCFQPAHTIGLPVTLPFEPAGSTPFFQSVLETLGLVDRRVWDWQQDEDLPDVSFDSKVLIATDTSDSRRTRVTEEHVLPLVDGMYGQGHDIWGLGVGLRGYRTVFQEIGIRPDRIIRAEDAGSIIAGFDWFATASAQLAIEAGK